MAFYVLFIGTSTCYVCDKLTGTAFITTGILGIHMQLINLIITYRSLTKLMALQPTSVCINSDMGQLLPLMLKVDSTLTCIYLSTISSHLPMVIARAEEIITYYQLNNVLLER